MKKIIICCIAAFSFVAGKAQFEYEGRVFYDSLQTQMKEVYHYLLRYTVSISAGRDTVINPEPLAVRHGSCILYRRDGTIEATGQYKDGKKTGRWKFYDEKGKAVMREENY